MGPIYTEAQSAHLSENVQKLLRMSSVDADFRWAGCVLLDCVRQRRITSADQIVYIHGPALANFSVAPENFPAAGRIIAATGVVVKEIQFIQMLAATPMIVENGPVGLYRRLVRYSLQNVPTEKEGVKNKLAAFKRDGAILARDIAVNCNPMNFVFIQEIRNNDIRAKQATAKIQTTPPTLQP